MAFDEHLADRVRQAFHKLHAHAEEKRMMGGLCFMVNDKMCAGVVNETLMARIGPGVYADALTRPGCREMDFTGRPMRGFVFVDAEGIENEEDLLDWIQMCLDYNPRARKSSKSRKTTTRS